MAREGKYKEEYGFVMGVDLANGKDYTVFSVSELEPEFVQFTNEAFCRREINQHKARKLWEKLRSRIPDSERRKFEVEWSHYMLGEFGAAWFGDEVNLIKKYFVIHKMVR